MARKESAKGKLTLITGASVGIGRELAKVFAEHGANLVLVSRSEDKLRELASGLAEDFGIEAEVIAKDLLDPAAPREIFDALQAEGKPVDILVNNAGALEFGNFADMTVEESDAMVQLNIAALTKMTRLFVGPMAEKKSGRVLNVASIGGFQPIPSLAVYAATKAYVLSLTESLAEELRGTHVTVTALCPGLTKTDMLKKASFSNEMARLLPSLILMNPHTVAREGYRACMMGRVLQVPGIANQASVNWVRMQPRWVVRTIGGFFGRRLSTYGQHEE